MNKTKNSAQVLIMGAILIAAVPARALSPDMNATVLKSAVETERLTRRLEHWVSGGAGRANAVVGSLGAPDPGSIQAVVNSLCQAATRMRAAVERNESDDRISAAEQGLQDSLNGVIQHQADLPRGGGLQYVAELKYKVHHMGELLASDDGSPESFNVGPVTPQQRNDLMAAMQNLLDLAGRMRGQLGNFPPELMYRNLLIAQMKSMTDPVLTVRGALGSNPPWWTPDAYEGVMQVQRLVALTKNETRKLTPELMASLQAVWTASQRMVAVVNQIEHGARDTGPEGRMVYQPRPGSSDQ